MSWFRFFEFIRCPSPFSFSKSKQFSFSTYSLSYTGPCFKVRFRPWHEICKILGFSFIISANVLSVATELLKFTSLFDSSIICLIYLFSVRKSSGASQSVLNSYVFYYTSYSLTLLIRSSSNFYLYSLSS